MSEITDNIIRFFKRKEEEFKPYYEKENSFRRLIVIHSIAAFLITPAFTLLIYPTEIPRVYVYLGISYTLLFPVYSSICWFVKFFRDKLIYFFVIHLFGMTFFAFLSLLINNFELTELFCFYALFAVTTVVMQRWYPLLLYHVFVICLVLYGLNKTDDIHISKGLFIGFMAVIILSSTLVLYARQKMINAVEDYSEYLKSIINNPDTGYILFDMKNERKIMDFNLEAAKIFNQKNATLESLKEGFFENFDENEIKALSALKIGTKFKKTLNFRKNPTSKDRYMEFKITITPLKNGNYWLAKISDVTDQINKRIELENSEKKFRNLYNRNKAGVFTINQESEIVDGNEAFFEMVSGTIGQGDKLFGINNQEEWNFIINRLRNNESLKNFQTQIQLSNGIFKTFIFSWYLDNQTQLVEGSVIDVTSIQKATEALKQSEEKYRLIFEESNDAILLIENDSIIEVNRRAVQLFGLSEKLMIGKNLYDLTADKNVERERKYRNYKLKLSKSRSVKFEWEFGDEDRIIEADVSIIEIMLGQKQYLQCVIHDRTDQNKYLRTIEQNKRNLENILENNPEGILIIKDTEVLFKNREIANLFGEDIKDLEDLFMKTDKIKFDRYYLKHKEKRNHYNFELNLINKNKENILADITLVSTDYMNKEATLVIIKDISVQKRLAKERLRAELAEETNKKLEDEIQDRIKAETMLQEQFLRTKAILDSSSNTFLLTLTLDNRISSYNSHCRTYFSHFFKKIISEGILFNDYFTDIFSVVEMRFFTILLSEVKRGESRQFEIRLKGGDIWLEIFMNPIFDTEGNVAEISMVAHDISEKKKSSIKIIESLKEKEVLLKEIHHRVKNNLQVISSILNLQSSFVTDEKTLSILQEGRNRIRSMAIIHESLYQSEDFSSINFSGYLKNLTTNLIASYHVNREVSMIHELENVDLVLDQAIPCGLLVNEIITNSLKYAWDEGMKGIIEISLSEKKNRVFLRIGDNGKGLKTKFQDMKSDTLGLQLITTLVEQLDGEINVDIEQGTKYLITFDNIKPKSHV